MRKKLIIILILVSVMPLLTASGLLHYYFNESLRSSFNQISVAKLLNAKENINEFVTISFKSLHLLALNQDIRSLNPPVVKATLEEGIELFPDITTLAVVNASGETIARSDDKHLSKIADRTYFTEAMQGKDYISELIIGRATQKPMIILSSPIYANRDKQVTAVIHWNINIEKFVDITKRLSQDNEVVFIVDNSGRILAHPDPHMTAERRNMNNRAFVQKGLAGEQGTMEYIDDNNQRKLVYFMPDEMTGWLVCYEIPYEVLMEHQRKIRDTTLIVMVVSCLLVVFIGVFMANFVVRPILALVRKVEGISQGNFTERIKMSYSDEIGELALKFNIMAESLDAMNGLHAKVEAELRQARDELEIKVEQRTSELTQLNEELQRISLSDGLTGIANRRYFDEYLEREWQRAKKQKTSLALIMLDIDFFKAYNDTYGHLAGDQCLKTIAKTLENRSGQSIDVVARYGGEEFAVILPEADEQEAMVEAELLRLNIEKLGIEHKKSLLTGVVTISVGVAVAIPSQEDTMLTIIHAADQALYNSKKKGRNQVS